MIELAEHGVGVVAIGALVTITLKFLGFMKHEVRKSTEANTELTLAIKEMLTYLKKRNGSR